MKDKLQHKLIKYTSILILVVILFPSVVKFTHLFEEHKHEVCINPTDSHFHELEIDCEFYKFNLNNNFTPRVSSYELLSTVDNNKTYYSYYYYLNSHQQLSSYLRGPPNLM